jgi:hypothetical protein
MKHTSLLYNKKKILNADHSLRKDKQELQKT